LAKESYQFGKHNQSSVWVCTEFIFCWNKQLFMMELSMHIFWVISNMLRFNFPGISKWSSYSVLNESGNSSIIRIILCFYSFKVWLIKVWLITVYIII
jgi:hypothetical protein